MTVAQKKTKGASMASDPEKGGDGGCTACTPAQGADEVYGIYAGAALDGTRAYVHIMIGSTPHLRVVDLADRTRPVALGSLDGLPPDQPIPVAVQAGLLGKLVEKATAVRR